jgi:hypothetical protein
MARLAEANVAIHFEGLAPVGNDTNPVCAIWADSEKPTPEEIALLGEIASERLRGRKIVGRGIAENVAMVTFRKLSDGSWMFRYSDWEGAPEWCAFFQSLEEFLSALKSRSPALVRL